MKEIKISIHRKYTKDFQSYGYRIGLQMDVDKDDPRSAYYEGKAFLNERIAEEDLIIKNIMNKKDAERGSGYKELVAVPVGKVKKNGLGGVAEKELVVKSYLCGGCGTWLVGEKGVDGKVFCKKCGCRKHITATNISRSPEVDGGDGNVMIPIDVRQIEVVSDKAVLVELFGDKGKVWVPKSCVR
ncbi:unnamed protein product, partial [marine sediment metagenome]